MAAMDSYIDRISVDLPPQADFFHRGSNSITPAEYGPFIHRLAGFDALLASQDFVILGAPKERDYRLFGAVTASRSLTYFLAHREHGRFASVLVYQPEIRRGETPEEVVCLRGDDWRDLLQEYANIAAERAGVSVRSAGETVTGYCSWYFSYAQVSEQEFLANVRALAEHLSAFSARFVQIDDGYQPFQGDWLERNDRWPRPLSETATTIRSAGFQPGIWLMPFLASTASNVFRDHPDWVVHDEAGRPLWVRGWSPAPDDCWACLDATDDRVQQHMRDVVGRFWEWGFRYFKLDGLGFAPQRGRRACSNATGISAFRTGLKVIRNAIPDATLLGCGGPFLPSLGLVDHARVGPDTGRTWRAAGLLDESGNVASTTETPYPSAPCLENALHASLSNWWQYDRWYRADPDVVMARDNNTHLTFGEARMSALAAILCGMVFTSDRLDLMSEERRRLLTVAAASRIRAARPVLWEKDPWPCAFAGTLDGRSALALFNFANHPRQWDIGNLGFSGGAREALRPCDIAGDCFTLPPHDAALLVPIP